MPLPPLQTLSEPMNITKFGCGQAQLGAWPLVSVLPVAAPDRMFSESKTVVLDPSTIELELVRASQGARPVDVPRNMTPVFTATPKAQFVPGALAYLPALQSQ